MNWSGSTRGTLEVCVAITSVQLNQSTGWKLLQWDFIYLLLWELVTWLWHLFHWYLQDQSGSWFIKPQQPGPVCLLCRTAPLQNPLQPSCEWTPMPSSLLLCWDLLKCLYGQLFIAVAATEIFPGCMKGFLESFCTAAGLYARQRAQRSGGGRVRIFPVLQQKQGVKTRYFSFKEQAKGEIFWRI